MYIESVPNRSSPPAVLLRETWRDRGARKVRRRTLANLSRLPPEPAGEIRACLRAAASGPPPQGRPTGRSGSRPRCPTAPSRQRPGRSAGPASTGSSPRGRHGRGPHRRARGQARHGPGPLPGERVRHARPDARRRGRRRERAPRRHGLAPGAAGTHRGRACPGRHPGGRSLVLRDLTPVRMEGHRRELAGLGHSRDGGRGRPQAGPGPMCDREGRQVAVEIPGGNASNPSTAATAASRPGDVGPPGPTGSPRSGRPRSAPWPGTASRSLRRSTTWTWPGPPAGRSSRAGA